jgi:hypothetical protein
VDCARCGAYAAFNAAFRQMPLQGA